MKESTGYLTLLYEKYRKHLAKDIVIVYEGDVSHQIIKAFTSLVEEKLEAEQEDESVQRKVYHILVECLQNINRHAEVFRNDLTHFPGRGALVVTMNRECYNVTTINLIQKTHVGGLSTFLESINPMSEDDLNELYRDQLVDGKISSKGGAGLGFIDIRRKTRNNLEYEFLDHDEMNSFFVFNVKISR